MSGQLILGESSIVAVFEYDPELVAAVKRVPGARWDRAGKAWHIPVERQREAVAVAVEQRWWVDPAIAAMNAPDPSPVDVLEFDQMVVRLRFGYDQVKVRAVKQIPGVTWDQKSKGWVAPATSLAEAVDWAEKFAIPITEETYAERDRVLHEHEEMLRQSRDVDADIEVAGIPLLGYQRAGVAYAAAAKRTFIADDMGLGKSLQAIATLEHLNDTVPQYPALVICPPTLLLNWRNEYGKWLPHRSVSVIRNRKDWPTEQFDVLVVGYSNIKAWENQLQGFRAYVFDESHYCFPGDTRVATSNGYTTIQEIFETDEDVYVATCASWSSAIGYNRVVSKFKLTSHELVKVSHEYGEFICTPDHRVLTQFGYREASSLTQDCYLRVLPEAVPGKESNKQVLLQVLQGDSNSVLEEHGGKEHRIEAARCKREDDGEQSNAFRGNTKEGVQVSKANGAQANDSGRKWAWGNQGTADAVGSIRRWLANGICSFMRKSKISRTANSLQDRYSKSFRNESSRGGWGFSQDFGGERKGQPEGSVSHFSRVVGVEVHERAGGEPVGNGSFVYPVYDIEVEETHTFFADGVLVSNCKSPDAQRTKAAIRIAKSAPDGGAVLCLTGTPVTNKPAEYAPQLELLGKLKDFGGKMGFYRRYCNAFRDRFGHWNIDGHSNLDELNERLRGNCYIRRTKDQVMAELPKVRHNKILVEGAPAAMKEYREAEANIVKYLMDRAAQIAVELGEKPGSAAVRAKMRAERNEHLVKIGTLRKLAARAKMVAVVEWVDAAIESGNKVVIAAHHREIVDELATRYGNLKIQGQMDVVAVERNKKIFQDQSVADAPVIVLSIQAAKTGHTLTASQDVLFVELPWTWADVDQTYSRCHRLGQKGSVTATYLLCEGTIDEKIYDVVERKREVVKAAVEGGEMGSASSDVFDMFLSKI